MLAAGASIGYYQGDVKLIIDDIAALRPTFFAGVPRVYDRVYSGILSKVLVQQELGLCSLWSDRDPGLLGSMWVLILSEG